MSAATTIPQDDEARQRIWIALSELFLDNELDAGDIDRLAEVVRESGVGRAELTHIFRYELSPFLGPNLWNVAGEWVAFDEEQVVIEARRRRGRPSWMARLLRVLRVYTARAQPEFDLVCDRAYPPARDS